MSLKLSRRNTLLVVALVLLLIGLVLELNDYGMSEKRVYGTKGHLRLYREVIQQFKEEKDVYPSVLKDAIEFSTQQGQVTLETGEYITAAKGNDGQYGELNGKGGWYYNSDTGEVRVNVTVPVKSHLKLYLGKERNEIPSEW